MNKINKKRLKINIQTLKPKRRRAKYNVRTTFYSCPNCLSTVKIIDNGALECTGNNLLFWQKELDKFNSLNETQQKKYLKNLSDKNLFLSWQKNGKVECGWSSKQKNQEKSTTQEIPDPIAVSKIEVSLGRPLTTEELEKNYIFYRKLVNGEYDYALEKIDDSWSQYKIPFMQFR